jgi:hypothetical protein
MSGTFHYTQYQYRIVPASTTQVLTSENGAFVHRVIVTVSTILAAPVTLTDAGAVTITLLPTGTAVGSYNIELNVQSINYAGTNNFSLVTPANCTAAVIGDFSLL